MQIRLLLLFVIFHFSCSLNKNKSNTNTKSSEIKVDFNKYKYATNEFKVVFFCNCLEEAYQKKSSIRQVLKNDNSRASDFPLGINNYRQIDSLAKAVNLEIIQDSIIIAKRFCGSCDDEEELKRFRANGMIGKRIMKHCLEYYESEELDSIAKKSISKLIKSQRF